MLLPPSVAPAAMPVTTEAAALVAPRAPTAIKAKSIYAALPARASAETAACRLTRQPPSDVDPSNVQPAPDLGSDGRRPARHVGPAEQLDVVRGAVHVLPHRPWGEVGCRGRTSREQGVLRTLDD